MTVKTLNEKLNAAKTAADAGDFDTAMASLTEATQVDATRDLLWFKLGDYYRMSATKQTDPAEKQKRLASAVESYQKAVDIKKSITNDKDPNAAKNLAAYYNNLAEAYAKSNKVDDAVKTYALAAQADPTNAAAILLQHGGRAHQCRQGRRCARSFRQGDRRRSQSCRCLLLEGCEHDRQGHACRATRWSRLPEPPTRFRSIWNCSPRAPTRMRPSRC